MPASSDARSPLRSGTPLRAAGALVTAALVTAAASACSTGSPPPDEPALSTPLASYDTQGAVVKRGPFCDLVSPDALEEAVGSVVEPTTWEDGDKIRVDGGRDLVQEYGCSWTGKRVRARAWVAAPPVTADLAREMIRERPGKGCRPLEQADAFGTSSHALRCADGTVRYAGLFGDAWFTCELTTPKADPDLAGRWCVAVTTAAAS